MEGRIEGEKIQCERETSICPYTRGMQPTTQAWALTRNQTCDLLICGSMSNQLNHMGQGLRLF